MNYIIRPAKKSDIKSIWQIRNHPTARQVSGCDKIIPLENHISWFKQKYFSGHDNHCFVLENKNKKVFGYCRFDFTSEHNWHVISIAIDPKQRQKGLGHLLLSQSLSEFKSNKIIHAEIQKNNTASIKLFQKNNFSVYRQDDKNYYLKHNR